MNKCQVPGHLGLLKMIILGERGGKGGGGGEGRR